ncbi:MAG: GreA/GreB family elongation factor [Steroidobacteraceae bacterium]
MSRAFVKESDGMELQELPELLVSPHRNLVTPTGMRQIEATVERLQASLSRARAAEERQAIARIQRDLRYWTDRLHTAEVVAAATAIGKARFGSTVALEKRADERVEYQIVGEDEAEPAQGRISYVSPIAKLLIGRSEGDIVALPDGEAEILEIR